MTQGGPLSISPLIFNIMVDAIVREWLRQVLGAEAARYGCGKATCTLMAIFYADDAMLASRDPEQLQAALDIIVGQFEHVGLRTNTTKTKKVMTCVPGKIRTSHITSVYNGMQEGLVVSSELQTRSVDCDICGQTFQSNTLSQHLETQHNVYRSRRSQSSSGKGASGL